MLLGAIYENDFYDFSYGFREGRSPHQAIGTLREIIKRRGNDGGVLRYIRKWFNAGVLEGESLSYPEKGTPQGVISPMISNIFLHHVLDEWYEKEVKPRLKGRSFLIRFADDFIIGCEREEDA